MAEVSAQPAPDTAAVDGALRPLRRPVSSGLYLAALLVFLLPFVSVSCGAQTVLTLSGTDLTFGRDLGPQFGTSAQLGITAGHLDSHLWLLLALLAPIVGLALTWLQPAVQDRAVAIALVAIGASGVLMMLTVLGDIASTNSAIQSGCQGQAGCTSISAVVQVSPAVGVWLETLLDIGMAALGILWLARWPAATGPPAPAPAPSGQPPG
jgi:hypothetical protein